MKNLRKRMISAVLAVSVLAGLLIPCNAVNAYEEGDLKPGIYQQLDNVDRFSPGTSEDWVKSGNYSYEFLDSEKKYITIRRIEEEAVVDGKLVIPKEIDGYPVLGIGIFCSGSMGEKSVCCVMEHPEVVEELILPEGLEYLGDCAFEGCRGLKKIDLPDTLVYIRNYSLVGSGRMDIKFMEFPYQVYYESYGFGSHGGMHIEKAVLYSDSMVSDSFGNEEVGFTIDEELHVRFHGKDSFELVLPSSVSKVYIDKKIKSLLLPIGGYDNTNDYLAGDSIKKLIMNGEDTKLVPSPDIMDVGLWGGVEGLYTVKGAKSIQAAKKYKIPYYWKKTGKTREVKGKKKNGKYKAEWKKTATKVVKNTYDSPEEKWETKLKTVKTEYKVYGKRKKSETYKLLKTTTKNSIKSEYKYIKAVPVKTWD